MAIEILASDTVVQAARTLGCTRQKLYRLARGSAAIRKALRALQHRRTAVKDVLRKELDEVEGEIKLLETRLRTELGSLYVTEIQRIEANLRKGRQRQRQLLRRI